MSDEGQYIREKIVSLFYVKAVLYKRTIQQKYFDKETVAMNNEELPALSAETKKVLQELANELKECDIDFWQLNEVKKIQLILDCTTIGKTENNLSQRTPGRTPNSTSDISTPYYKIQRNLGSEVIIQISLAA